MDKEAKKTLAERYDVFYDNIVEMKWALFYMGLAMHCLFGWYVHTKTYEVSIHYKIPMFNALGWLMLPIGIFSIGAFFVCSGRCGRGLLGKRLG